ncbi:AFG1/ZapE family ATPase [Nocardia farcinica]|uniref:AFG1/ZapE family ATPase n=1 Tax=Nocardia farcinica TaxID=37329 RepID=UPI00313DA6F5
MPATRARRWPFHEFFALLGGPPCAATTAVRIGAHTVPVHAATAGTLVASFTDLCGSAVSAADYVALAARFERWVIGAVPLLRTCTRTW